MQTDVLTGRQKKLVELVAEYGNDYYLVGGIALALQWGHRRSVDYDLFTGRKFDGVKIERQVGADWEVSEVFVSSKNELTMVVEG